VNKHPAVEALRKASKGLLFPSESEAPLESFLWEDGGKLTKDRLRQLAGAEEGDGRRGSEPGRLVEHRAERGPAEVRQAGRSN
jgi:hypothetical protein